MANINYTYDDYYIPEDHNIEQGTFEVYAYDLRSETLDASSSSARLTVDSAADGEISVDLVFIEGTPSSFYGLMIRATDANNGIHLLTQPSTNTLRLIQVVGGVSQSPDLLTHTTSISAQTTRKIGLEYSGDQIIVKVDGSQVGSTVTSSYNQTESLVGLRTGGPQIGFNNFNFPEPLATVKSVTFDLPAQLQSLGGLNYIVSAIPLGEAILNGSNLDTSGTTVVFDLDGLSSLSSGDPLMLIATDKQVAEDSADVIGWSASTVYVEV